MNIDQIGRPLADKGGQLRRSAPAPQAFGMPQGERFGARQIDPYLLDRRIWPAPDTRSLVWIRNDRNAMARACKFSRQIFNDLRDTAQRAERVTEHCDA